MALWSWSIEWRYRNSCRIHSFTKKHLVYYDPNNQTEFNELLDYYVKNQDEARKIGLAGYNFVLDHHMAIDRVSYILDMVRSKIKPVCQSCRKFNRTARSG